MPVIAKPVEIKPVPAAPLQPAKNGTAKPAAKKTAAKPKKAPPVEEKKQETTREIIYPDVEAQVCVLDNAITVEKAKAYLGWETEKDFAKRCMEANPGSTLDAWKFDDTMTTLLDEDKQKVICWNNTENRPFDDAWCRSLAQDILNRNWAGPLTIPGETVNGETITISRTGQVKSGQHRLIALILAAQMWMKNRKRWDRWDTEPALETIVIKGISDSKLVAMTVDNCKPRSEADVFYTSALFDTLIPQERKECSRMLANAADFLWARTDTKGYKTHTEIVAFVDRHKRIVECMEHLFKANSKANNRAIASLGVSAGQCASVFYMMASSGEGTDGDVYRNGLPPSEKGLDWSMWDKAAEFWSLIGKDDQFTHVRYALNRLHESDAEGGDNGDNIGLGGRKDERWAIISKAWDVFKIGMPVMLEDVKLNYTTLDEEGNQLPEGKEVLLDFADFGGIDVPQVKKTTMKQIHQAPDPIAPTPEELEKLKEEAVKRRAENAKKILAMRPKTAAK